MSKFLVKATIVNGLLGTLPSDPELYRSYIKSKAPDALDITDEIECIGEEGMYNKIMTVFPHDESGDPFVFNYLIKGFFKNACSMLREIPSTESSKFKNYKKKIDGRVFIWPRRIPLYIDGRKASKSDITISERPLRASTPKGERVGISVSEQLPEGTVLEFEVETLGDDLDNAVIEWLNYGRYNGLGQWHNSSMGSFTYSYEIVEPETVFGSTKSNNTETTEVSPAPKKRGRKKKEPVETETEN